MRRFSSSARLASRAVVLPSAVVLAVSLAACGQSPSDARAGTSVAADGGSAEPGHGDAGAGLSDAGEGQPDAGNAVSTGDASTPSDAASGVRLVGRMDTTTPGRPKFEWEGSAIEARFTGSQVAVTIAGDPTAPNYFAALVDGVQEPTLVVNGAAASSYPIATGLGSGVHTVVVSRRAESFQNTTQFVGFDFGTTGQLLSPPAAPARRIEVIGDSITAGYGVECANESTSFTAATENEYIAYGSIAARGLGADAHILAWSGEGVYRNYNNNSPDAGTLMPVYWLRTLATVATSTWDFTQWTPDVVVVNLGTNDFSGTPPADIDTQFEAAYLAFLQKIHQTYPQAYLFCALGPMLSDPHLTEARTAINGAISSLKTGGFSRVGLVEFPVQNCGSDGSGCGCDAHPNVATHQQMATLLEAAIKPALGW